MFRDAVFQGTLVGATRPPFLAGDSTEAEVSTEEIVKLLCALRTAVHATTSSSQRILTKAHDTDHSLDVSSGLSLLLVRPHMLLSSLHHIVVLLALNLSSPSSPETTPSSSDALTTPFAASQRIRKELEGIEDARDELAGELAVSQEVMEKVKGLEGKLDYQITKLIGLAEAEKAKELVEDVDENPLSFRPNLSAITSAAPGSSGRAGHMVDREYTSNSEGELSNNLVYRPPRVAAVPYNEPTVKGRRTDRRVPAFLSEFATIVDGAPLIESTSGLSTRPAQASRHTNSASAKRADELNRINRFEEENMTRLVTTKREAKRRREDEAALALGYGVGGPSRSYGRKQNGLEAEFEGVLGDRGSRGLWEGVGAKLGKRDGVMDRGSKPIGSVVLPKSRRPRFEKDVRSLRKQQSSGAK